MAAKKNVELTFADIVMGAKADVIKKAYEARLQIDEHLAAREEAYRRIAELEQKIEDIVGSPGDFVFPPPPLPVVGNRNTAESRRTSDKTGSGTRSKTKSKGASSGQRTQAPGAKTSPSSSQKTGDEAQPPTPKDDDTGTQNDDTSTSSSTDQNPSASQNTPKN